MIGKLEKTQMHSHWMKGYKTKSTHTAGQRCSPDPAVTERPWKECQEYMAQLEMYGESVMGMGAAERKCCLPLQETLFVVLCPWHGAAGLLFPGSSPQTLVLQGCWWNPLGIL